MKVLVACSVIPFSDSPQERQARLLCQQLTAAGHASEILRIPFAATPLARLPSQLAMMRSFETWNIDHLVSMDVPASLLRHARKSVWLNNAEPLLDAPGTAPHAVLSNAAREALGESRGAYCSSHRVRTVLDDVLGVAPPVLALPPRHLADSPGRYILAAPPRDAGDTRLLAALARTGADVRLVFAGTPASPDQAARLQEAARGMGVGDRVELDLRPLTEDEFDRCLAGALAVACIGGADDGGLALRAAGAGKALIADAADTQLHGLARHQLSGWAVTPEVAALAACLQEAVAQRHRSLAYGARARDLLRVTGADWTTILQALLA
jgi:hypothetical protein